MAAERPAPGTHARSAAATSIAWIGIPVVGVRGKRRAAIPRGPGRAGRRRAARRSLRAVRRRNRALGQLRSTSRRNSIASRSRAQEARARSRRPTGRAGKARSAETAGRRLPNGRAGCSLTPRALRAPGAKRTGSEPDEARVSPGRAEPALALAVDPERDHAPSQLPDRGARGPPPAARTRGVPFSTRPTWWRAAWQRRSSCSCRSRSKRSPRSRAAAAG